MRRPNFAAGQVVALTPSKRLPLATGHYTIICAMPNSGGPIQYKIKGEQEKFERIIDEIHLGAPD